MQRWLVFIITIAGLCTCVARAGVLGTAAPVRPDAESIARTNSPRSLYILHCAGCHAMDGSGSEQTQVPDMRRIGQFLNHPEGRRFLIQVPGVMGSGLNDEEVAQVTNWIFTNLVLGINSQNFAPYTAAEIAKARATPLRDVLATRARLLSTEPLKKDTD